MRESLEKKKSKRNFRSKRCLKNTSSDSGTERDSDDENSEFGVLCFFDFFFFSFVCLISESKMLLSAEWKRRCGNDQNTLGAFWVLLCRPLYYQSVVCQEKFVFIFGKNKFCFKKIYILYIFCRCVLDLAGKAVVSLVVTTDYRPLTVRLEFVFI